MPENRELHLPLSAWLVLCLVCEKKAHGFAVAAQLTPKSSLGQIWQVPRPVVYRSLTQLEEGGLVRAAGPERTTRGPVRTPCSATPAGRRAARAWLGRPVAHPRDLRSELLLKLALLDRSGADSQELLRAQRAHLEPIAAALDHRLSTSAGFDHTMTLWRHEAITATMRFLDTLGLQP
jgi:PadR family transcriptional regulator AphA